MDCRDVCSRLAVLVVLTGCGPTSGSGDGGGDAGGTTSAGGDTSAGSGDGTGDVCMSYTPEAPGPEVSLKLFHQGTTPVFFRPYGCSGAVTFEVSDSDDTPLPYLLAEGCTPNTCAGFVAAASCEVGCNDCAPPQVGRLEPGSVSPGTWPGYRLTDLPLSASCVPGTECPTTCVRPDPVASGTYSIALTVYRTCTGDCECDGASPGMCTIWGEAELGDPAVFTATIDYPNVVTADLTISD